MADFDVYRLIGPDCGGCDVLSDAVARWRKSPSGDFESFVKEHYCREARLSGGIVMSLATEDALTDDELARASLYELAVMYEDGTISKQWKDPPAPTRPSYTKESAERLYEFRARTYGACPDNPHHYVPPVPCAKCSTSRRYLKSGCCVECDRIRSRELTKKARMAM